MMSKSTGNPAMPGHHITRPPKHLDCNARKERGDYVSSKM